MTRGEEATIKGFLIGVYKAVEDARTQGDDKLACAQSAYDTICRLAELLKVENPCEK